ncbi:MAG: hypothetical protein DRI32_08090 [Chloroflexi bacterium]|nr:MAG: hypothetical protein DRI32_08090 [Chloroflexota bacterium]
MAEILQREEALTEQEKLRESFDRIFWDINASELDWQRHYKLIITQVLNYGYVQEIQLLFRIYAKETIKSVLENPTKGIWHPKTYKAFCNLLDVAPQKKAVNILFVEKKTRKKINQLFAYLLKV